MKKASDTARRSSPFHVDRAMRALRGVNDGGRRIKSRSVHGIHAVVGCGKYATAKMPLGQAMDEAAMKCTGFAWLVLLPGKTDFYSAAAGRIQAALAGDAAKEARSMIRGKDCPADKDETKERHESKREDGATIWISWNTPDCELQNRN